MVQELEMILLLKRTNLKVSNGYSIYIDYESKNLCIVIPYKVYKGGRVDPMITIAL